jgi:NTE family protein
VSKTAKRLRGECVRVALVLQGGGALGSYQAGVYQALDEAGYRPDWVAGISIGAINAAIIAGNPPERRVEKLQQFWNTVTRDHGWLKAEEIGSARRALNAFSASQTMYFGVEGFFTPRPPNPRLALPNVNPETSYYDTGPLRATLEELIDFELINKGSVRLSVGAVDVEKGNFCYFDSKHRDITPEHIMASGALPPGFPAVEVDGAHFWDGGLVSNTPLNLVLEDKPRASTLAFQVDLFPARGARPSKMGEVEARIKDIRYSSRTRFNTDVFRRMHRMRHKLRQLADKLPAELQDDPEVQEIRAMGCATRMHIAHLIYRPTGSDLASKDYEFSRSTMERRWQDGYETTCQALASPKWRNRKAASDGVAVYDFGQIAASQEKVS